MDEPVLLVLLSDSELALDYLPDFSTLQRELADVLPEDSPPYRLVWGEPGCEIVVDNDEALTAVIEQSSGLPELRLVPEQCESPPPRGQICHYCESQLPLEATSCSVCESESWDEFFLSRFGFEAWESYSGNPAITLTPRVSVPVEDQRVEEKGYESGDEFELHGEEQQEDAIESPKIVITTAEPEGKSLEQPYPPAPSLLFRPSDEADAESSEKDMDSLPDSSRDFPTMEDSSVDKLLAMKNSEPDINLRTIDEADGQSAGEEEEKQREMEQKREENTKEQEENSKEQEKIDNGHTERPQETREFASEHTALRSGILYTSPYFQASLHPKSQTRSVEPTAKSQTRSPRTAERAICEQCFRLIPWYFSTCHYCDAQRSLEKLLPVDYRLRVKSKFHLSPI